MPKAPPKQHPKPYRSPLRPHVEAILFLRRYKRMTWAEIARQLKTDHGIAVHRSTVFRVYKRAQAGCEPFGLEATARLATPARPKSPIIAFAAEPSNSSKLKNTGKEGYPKRRITAEELLMPIPRRNSGAFAKWQEQQTQQKKKNE
jgi:hypothetical protein